MCAAGAGAGALAPEKQGDFLKNRKIRERGTQLVPGGGGREDTVGSSVQPHMVFCA